MKTRVAVMHGVNLDQLGRRDPEHYPAITLTELEVQVKGWAADLGLEPSFFQTNHEGKFCEELQKIGETQHGIVLNPGAWTHYSWAIRDALEVTGLPAVEVHLSAVDEREPWRRTSVLEGLCVGTVQGKGVEGYRDGLELLKRELQG